MNQAVAAVLVVLSVSTLVVDSTWLNCSPRQPVFIRCKVSSNPADCNAASNERVYSLPLRNVINLAVTHVENSTTNGVIVSWKSPNAMTLNATTGYLMKIYRYQSMRLLEVCRTFKVWSLSRFVSYKDASITFSYTVDRLLSSDSDYIVELHTLPFSVYSLASPSSVYFQTGEIEDVNNSGH